MLAHRPDLCDSYNGRRLIRGSGLTAERLATAVPRSRLPNLMPTHDRGPQPLRRRSTGCCYRPEGAVSCRWAGADELPGIASTRLAGLRPVASDEFQNPGRLPRAAGSRVVDLVPSISAAERREFLRQSLAERQWSSRAPHRAAVWHVVTRRGWLPPSGFERPVGGKSVTVPFYGCPECGWATTAPLSTALKAHQVSSPDCAGEFESINDWSLPRRDRCKRGRTVRRRRPARQDRAAAESKAT